MIDGGLRKLFRIHLPTFHWVSVETGLTEQGVPDSNYCVDGIEGWVEYKLSITNKVWLKPEQIGWHERRARAGGRTFIAVRFNHLGGPRKGQPKDCLFIYAGAAVRSVAVSGLTVPSLARWENGPARWDWAAIGKVLIEPSYHKKVSR